MPLRFYQEDARLAVLFALEEMDSALLNLPTGSGKTVVAAHIIRDYLPRRCLFLVDQDELASQSLGVIERECGVIPALEKATSRASLAAKIVVASSQTLSNKKRLERFPPKFFDLCITDESHRGRKRDKKITDYLCKKVVGITATPFTAGLKDLSDTYETVAYSMPMLNLIGDGFAPPYKVLRLPVEIDLAEVTVKRGLDGKDFEAESLCTTIAPYYEKICELLKPRIEKLHSIAFLPLIKSSQAFAAIARSYGITAVHIDGTSPDRELIIERFRRGQIQLLCNAGVLTTGVDIPIADCFINLTPMKSPVRYQQAFGRVLRVLPGVIDDIPGKDQAEERRARIAASAKPEAWIVDFLWQHDKLNVYKPENMIAGSEEEARMIFEKSKNEKDPVDILALQKLVQQEREALLVKQLERVASRSSSRMIEPETFGLIIGNRQLMNYEPVARWEQDKPTDAQIHRLKRWGIDPSKVTSKGQASILIGAFVHRFQFQLATVNQLRTLQKMEVKFNPDRLTMNEAVRLISQSKLAAMR